MISLTATSARGGLSSNNREATPAGRLAQPPSAAAYDKNIAGKLLSTMVRLV